MPKKKEDNRGLRIIGTILLIIAIGWLLSSVLYPAYLSFSAVCTPETFESTVGEDFQTAGKTTTDSETGETSVEIFLPSNSTLKHEWVHVVQRERGFPSASCGMPVSKYFGEVEAYLMENLPNSVFDGVYGGGWRGLV